MPGAEPLISGIAAVRRALNGDGSAAIVNVERDVESQIFEARGGVDAHAHCGF